eukprot:gene10926-3631_t
MTVKSSTQQYISGGKFNTKPIFVCDSKYFVVGNCSQIKICITATGKILHNISTKNDDISHLQKNPQNDEQFYSSSQNGSITLWNAEENTKIQEWEFNTKIQKFFFEGQNSKIFIQNSEGIFETSFEKKELKQLSKIGNTQNMTYYAEKKLLFFTHEHKIHQLNLSNKKEFICALDQQIVSLAVSIFGVIAVSDSYGSIKLFNPFESKPFSNITWHPLPVNSITFSADGLYLFSGGDEGLLVMWYLQSSQKTFFPVYSKISNISISDNLQHFLCSTKNNFISILESSNKKKNKLELKKTANIFFLEESYNIKKKIVFKPNSNDIVLNGNDNIQFFDYENGEESDLIEFQFKAILFNPSRFKYNTDLKSIVSNISFNKNGTYFATSEIFGDKFNMKFFDFEKMKYKLITVVDSPHSAEITSLVSHPKENLFVSSSDDGYSKFWSLKKNSFICTGIISFRKLKPSIPSFSKDGSLLIVPFHNILTFWDVDELTMIHSFFSENQIEKCLTLSDDLIIFNDKFSIFVYSIENSSIVFQMKFSNVSNLICDSKLNFSIIKDEQTILTFNFADRKNPLKQQTKSDSKIISQEYNSENEIIFLNSKYEIYKITNKEIESKQQETEKPLVKKNVIQIEQKVEKQDNVTLFAYDPDVGRASWRTLLKGPTHALTTTSNMYNSFMDGFLVKNQKNEESKQEKESLFIPNEQQEEKEELVKKQSIEESYHLFSKIGSKI